jgi:isopentenyl-diphosphate Delta-isomerase
MPDNSILPSRKSDHIRINLVKDVRSTLTTGLEKYQFIHRALPELNLSEVDTRQKIFGKILRAPILISSMTGGTPEASIINQTLAAAAEKCGVAMGVGSQRAAIEDQKLAYTFQIRRVAPTALIFANLGAIQLNYGYSIEQCRKAVDMIEADALILHLNSLQEALQPEGDTKFSGLLSRIETICRQMPVPVIVKEVGWGISEEDARLLASAGVAAIDVAGAGGTSWSQVEMYRMEDASLARLAAGFRNWGIPTSDSIRMVRLGAPGLPIFASGGIRDGIEIAKCVALGATLAGMAGRFLKAAVISLDEILGTISEIQRELQVCMFAVGAANLKLLDEKMLMPDKGR